MQIVFLIKPYAINMYSFKDNVYNLLGTQDISYIENESHTDYENRMIYVSKDISQDFINTDLYKQNKKEISNIKIILTNPWCIYEIMNIEKDFEKPEKINDVLINQLLINKKGDGFSILKNGIYNIALNGYNIKRPNNQLSQKIHIQYLSIYSSTNFLNRLKNTLETIFHLHNIEIDSIYSYINEIENENKIENQFKIIVEDKGLDLSYIYQNKNIATFFIPCGCFDVKNKIKEILHIDDLVLEKILKSKSKNLDKEKTTLILEKNLDNIWPDLDEDVKNKIDLQIDSRLEIIKRKIRDFIDSIDIDLIKKDTNISIICLDEKNLFTLGLILEDAIKNDIYTLDKLLTNKSNVFTKKMF